MLPSPLVYTVKGSVKATFLPEWNPRFHQNYDIKLNPNYLLYILIKIGYSFSEIGGKL